MNEREDDESPVAESRPVLALADGIGAFVASFLVFFGVTATTGSIDFSTPVRLLKQISHLFYNSFNVPAYTRQTVLTQENGTVVSETVRETWQNGITGWIRLHQETRVSGELVEETTQTSVLPVDSALPPLVYLLIPVVVLLAIGLAFGYRSLDTEAGTSLKTLAIRSLVGGGILTVGFLLVTLVGSYVMVLEGTQAIRHPARLEALLYGFAYPAVLGTLGIAAGQYLRRTGRDEGSSRETDDAGEEPPEEQDEQSGGDARDPEPDSPADPSEGANDDEPDDDSA